MDRSLLQRGREMRRFFVLGRISDTRGKLEVCAGFYHPKKSPQKLRRLLYVLGVKECDLFKKWKVTSPAMLSNFVLRSLRDKPENILKEFQAKM